MAITTLDGLVAGIAAGRTILYHRPTAFSGGMTGRFLSLWSVPATGGYPSAGSTPATGSGAAPNKSTTGAIPIPTPGGGNTLYVVSANGSLGICGMVYDRLVHTSGLSGTTITAQTVNTTALTRYTDGAGVEAWLEWYTATGNTSRTATVSYTNQSGTAGRSGTCVIPGSCAARTMVKMLLQSGDTGVRSVESVTLSASTGTAGDFGVTLLKPIAGPTRRGSAGWRLDPFVSGFSAISNDACLAIMVLDVASSDTFFGSVVLAEG
jgi:hypothetical protein